MSDKVVMYDSDEAMHEVDVCRVTRTVGMKVTEAPERRMWRSRHGRIFPDQASARYDGCTHKVCLCGGAMLKHKTLCDECDRKRRHQRYLEMPYQDWDEEGPVTEHDGDRFFENIFEVLDHCVDHDIDPESLDLIICEKEHLHEFEFDEFYSEYANECLSASDVFPQIEAAFEEANKLIRKEQPFVWSPAGKYRTTVRRMEE